MQPRVLVVDSDDTVGESITRLLRRRGFDVERVADDSAALRAMSLRHFDVALLDINAGEKSPNALIDAMQQAPDPPLVLLMVGPTELPSMTEALRRSTSDVVEKPLDMSNLVARIERAMESATMRRRLRALEDSAKTSRSVVLGSDAMKRVFDLAEKVARTPTSSALILGESGVGKEVVSGHIHELSARASGPFVRVNLAAIPDSMIEGELFGSVRGSYTGSLRDRVGHFASADGGTLLLDEIGEFKVEHQAKLLRALEERRFFPIGSDRERSVNARVLAATNRDPSRLVADGFLREDLYYRLGTVIIRVPPLRDRTAEILPLARHFLSQFCRDFRRAPIALSHEAETVLLAHRWPGNVRELRNVMERAVMTSRSDHVTADDVAISPQERPRERERPQERESGEYARQTKSGAYERTTVTNEGADEGLAPASLRLDTARDKAITEFERAHIERVLKIAGASRTRAATLLGISRSTLYEKLKKYGMVTEPKAGTGEA